MHNQLFSATAGEHSATCTVTVEEALVGITSLSELSNEKLYYIVQPHHSKGTTSWAEATGTTALKSNVDLGIADDSKDAQQQFAIVSNDNGETYYLYHAAEKKFVGKDGTLGERPTDAVAFKAGDFDNTFVVYFDASHYINVGGSRQMVIDDWDTPDGGNSCLIVPVGDFDPKDALDAIITTGICDVPFGTDSDAVVYDLQGRRVHNVTKGGVYVVNGKKTVVR